MALATLKHWLEGYPVRRRTHRIELQPALYTWEALWPLFHTVEGRRQWLERLMPADAPVLADSGREVLLAWDKAEAVLGLKAFRMGPQQMLALDFSTWTNDVSGVDTIAAGMRNALERLATGLRR